MTARDMRIRYLVASAIMAGLYSVVLTAVGLFSAGIADAGEVGFWPIGALAGAVVAGVALAVLIFVVAVVGDQIARALGRPGVRAVTLAQGGVLAVGSLVLVAWFGLSTDIPGTTALALVGVILLVIVPGWLVVGVVPWLVGRSTGHQEPTDADTEPDETDEEIAVRREAMIQEALDRVRAREGC